MDTAGSYAEAASQARRPSDVAVSVAAVGGTAAPSRLVQSNKLEIPDYLHDKYYWAYLDPKNVRLLDREIIVRLILWGQHTTLRSSAFAELKPGQHVLQPACVYGDFSRALAEHLGREGRLEITDIAPIQLAACRRKLKNLPQAKTRRADTSQPDYRTYDAVCCYFLLHELPDEYKFKVVDSLLQRVPPGGKVVFVDYHKPHWAHPLKPITSFVFDTLEPFAKGLWQREIREFASEQDEFTWTKQTFFGSLFQKVVAQRKEESARAVN